MLDEWSFILPKLYSDFEVSVRIFNGSDISFFKWQIDIRCF